MRLQIMYLFFVVLLLSLPFMAAAQDSISHVKSPSPIPVEIMAGNNRLDYQILVNKKFSSESKFGFLSVSTFAADYKNNPKNTDYMTPALFNYDIVKGFGISAGAAVNSNWGFRPFAGLQYVYVSRIILLAVVPGVYLTESHNLETLALIEYKPKLSGQWSIYTRLQGFYNQNMVTNKHDRSYITGRLGLTYKKVGFGLGANEDWYGPLKVLKENYGIFVRMNLQ